MQLDYVDEVQHHKWNIMKHNETKVLAKCSARFLLLVWRWSWGDGTGPKFRRRHDMTATTRADAAVTAKIGKTSECVLMVLYLSESWNYPEMIAGKKELSDDMNCTHEGAFFWVYVSEVVRVTLGHIGPSGCIRFNLLSALPHPNY